MFRNHFAAVQIPDIKGATARNGISRDDIYYSKNQKPACLLLWVPSVPPSVSVQVILVELSTFVVLLRPSRSLMLFEYSFALGRLGHRRGCVVLFGLWLEALGRTREPQEDGHEE